MSIVDGHRMVPKRSNEGGIFAKKLEFLDIRPHKAVIVREQAMPYTHRKLYPRGKGGRWWGVIYDKGCTNLGGSIIRGAQILPKPTTGIPLKGDIPTIEEDVSFTLNYGGGVNVSNLVEMTLNLIDGVFSLSLVYGQVQMRFPGICIL